MFEWVLFVMRMFLFCLHFMYFQKQLYFGSILMLRVSTYHLHKRKAHISFPFLHLASSTTNARGEKKHKITFSECMHESLTTKTWQKVTKVGKVCYLLLLFLQLFVLHFFKLRPNWQHFLLQLSGAQLVDVQHQWELNILQKWQYLKTAC